MYDFALTVVNGRRPERGMAFEVTWDGRLFGPQLGTG
jgi:hypothetical protein